jgi:hypothetical protein
MTAGPGITKNKNIVWVVSRPKYRLFKALVQIISGLKYAQQYPILHNPVIDCLDPVEKLEINPAKTCNPPVFSDTTMGHFVANRQGTWARYIMISGDW